MSWAANATKHVRDVEQKDDGMMPLKKQKVDVEPDLERVSAELAKQSRKGSSSSSSSSTAPNAGQSEIALTFLTPTLVKLLKVFTTDPGHQMDMQLENDQVVLCSYLYGFNVMLRVHLTKELFSEYDVKEVNGKPRLMIVRPECLLEIMKHVTGSRTTTLTTLSTNSGPMHVRIVDDEENSDNDELDDIELEPLEQPNFSAMKYEVEVAVTSDTLAEKITHVLRNGVDEVELMYAPNRLVMKAVSLTCRATSTIRLENAEVNQRLGQILTKRRYNVKYMKLLKNAASLNTHVRIAFSKDPDVPIRFTWPLLSNGSLAVYVAENEAGDMD
jgi:hypothetical protein